MLGKCLVGESSVEVQLAIPNVYSSPLVRHYRYTLPGRAGLSRTLGQISLMYFTWTWIFQH